MSCYDADVITLIGENIHKVLLKAVDDAKIDQKKAEAIAEQLHPTVVGNFRRQVSSDSSVFNRGHFREILSDWYRYSAFDFKHKDAVKCLVNALIHDNVGKNNQKQKLGKATNHM